MGSIDRTPDLKSNIVVSHDEIPKPPVADDFMYDFKYNHPLPTTDLLGIAIPAECNAQLEAEGIVKRLSAAMENGNAPAFTDLFLESGKLTPFTPFTRARGGGREERNDKRKLKDNLTSFFYRRCMA